MKIKSVLVYDGSPTINTVLLLASSKLEDDNISPVIYVSALLSGSVTFANTYKETAGRLYTNSQTYNISSTPGASGAASFEYLGGQKSSLAPIVCIVTYANIRDVEFISKWVCLPYA
jgi:hypothetical protein